MAQVESKAERQRAADAGGLACPFQREGARGARRSARLRWLGGSSSVSEVRLASFQPVMFVGGGFDRLETRASGDSPDSSVKVETTGARAEGARRMRRRVENIESALETRGVVAPDQVPHSP